MLRRHRCKDHSIDERYCITNVPFAHDCKMICVGAVLCTYSPKSYLLHGNNNKF